MIVDILFILLILFIINIIRSNKQLIICVGRYPSGVNGVITKLYGRNFFKRKIFAKFYFFCSSYLNFKDMATFPSNNRIYLSTPEFEGKELKYIENAFQAKQVATHGAFIQEFECRIKEKFGAEEVVALNSGTSAIHIALMLLGVKGGDEVICQTLTFVASANPIVYLGGIPVFVDSERDTWNICPQFLEEAILDRIRKGKLPKAIIMVNLFGMPAKTHEILEIAGRYGIPVLEDAAESIGSKISGQYCGTLGDIGVFSFNGNKVITTGGGGVMITPNLHWSRKARHLSTQAKDNFPYYHHSEIGYNYKMNNIAAGIGLAQLETLEEKIRKRRQNFEYYRAILTNSEGISFLDEPAGSFSNRWLTTVLIDPELAFITRDLAMELMAESNIEARPVWKPMHLQPIFRQRPYYGENVAADLFSKGLCLPSGGSLERADLDRVIGCLMPFYEKCTADYAMINKLDWIKRRRFSES